MISFGVKNQKYHVSKFGASFLSFSVICNSKESLCLLCTILHAHINTYYISRNNKEQTAKNLFYYHYIMVFKWHQEIQTKILTSLFNKTSTWGVRYISTRGLSYVSLVVKSTKRWQPKTKAHTPHPSGKQQQKTVKHNCLVFKVCCA